MAADGRRSSSSSTPTSPSTPTPSPGPSPGSTPTPASPRSSARTTTTRRARPGQPVPEPAPPLTSTSRATSSTTPGPPTPSGPAAALIRRDVFLDLGGFDPELYRRPAIEDIELGYRLTRAGHRIVLARDVLATHLKRWTLADVVRTDIFRRGRPLDAADAPVAGRRDRPERRPRPEALRRRDRARRARRDRGARAGRRWRSSAAGMPGGDRRLNRGFYRFLARREGWRFAVGVASRCTSLYFGCCGVSVVIAWRSGTARWPEPARRRRRRRGLRLDEPPTAAPRRPRPDTARDPEARPDGPNRRRVAVVRSDNRRGAVAQALALIADDLRRGRHARRPGQAEPRQPPRPAPLDPRRHPLGHARRPLRRRRRDGRPSPRGRATRPPGSSASATAARPPAGPSGSSTSTATRPTGSRSSCGRRRLAADGPGLEDGRRVALPRLARAGEDARNVDGDAQPQEHAFQPPPRRPRHDARLRRRRQRLRRAGSGRSSSSSRGTARSSTLLTRPMGRVRNALSRPDGQAPARRRGGGSRRPTWASSGRSTR